MGHPNGVRIASTLMLTGESEKIDAYIVHVDPAYPDAPNRPQASLLLEAMMQTGKHKNVVLVTGDKRRIIGDNPEIVERRLIELDIKTA